MLARRMVVVCAAAVLAAGCGKQPAPPVTATTTSAGSTGGPTTTASSTGASSGSVSSGSSGSTASGSTSASSASSGSTGASSTSSTSAGSTSASSTSAGSTSSSGSTAGSTSAGSTATGSTSASSASSTGASTASGTSGSTAASTGSSGTASTGGSVGSTGTSGAATTSSSSSSSSSSSASSTGGSGSTGGGTTGTTSSSSGSSSGGSTGGAPANDACTGAIVLTRDVAVSGDTRSATNDFDFKNTSCTGALTLGRDVVYSFTATAAGNYHAVLTPAGWDAALYALDACPTDGHGLSACNAGKDAAGSGGAEQLDLTLAAGQAVTLVVDSYSDTAANAAGAFTLLVRGPAADDQCGPNTPALSLNTTLAGDTTGYGDEYEDATGACVGLFAGTERGPDAIYAFTPPVDGLYNIAVTPGIRANGGSWDVGLWLVDGASCPAASIDATCVAGADPHGTGGTERLAVNLVGGHRYYVGVDGYQSTDFGPFTLSAVLEQPGDSCANASTDLAVLTGPGTSATINGATTLGFADDQTPSCSSGAGGDVAYAFTLSQAANLTVTVTPTSPGFTPVLNLETTCGGADTACRAGLTPGQAVTLVANNLAAGSYTLWVDGAGSSGNFNLSATLTAQTMPVNGDACSNPLPDLAAVQHVGDSANLSGSLQGASDDDFGSCTGSAGPDLVYTLSPAEDVTLAATVSPSSGAYRPVLYLEDFCSGLGGADLACNAASAAGGQASLGGVTLRGGNSYSLWVDSAGAGGPYSLSVAFLPPPAPPLGENCANVDQDGGSSELVLTPQPDGNLLAQAATDTRGYADNGTADPNGACQGHGAGGDRVYRLVLSAAAPSLTATLTPTDPNYIPVLYLRDSPCIDSGGQERSCGYTGNAGAATSFTTGPLPAGTYYLWVDTFSGTEGTGNLTVSVP